jgi:hypothetical protein
MSSSASAQLVPFNVGTSSPACIFEAKNLPSDMIVVAGGSYSGRPLTVQIDRSGHAATQFDVAVHSDKPVALLLGAYEPAIWNIGWTKSTRIVAVFATGYHRQVVAGLPKDVPVITNSMAEKGPCGTNYNVSELSWLNPKSRELFGKEVTRVYLKAPKGVLDITESTQPKGALVTSAYRSPESFVDKSAPLAGEAGLKAAVAKGVLRPISPGDQVMVEAAFRAKAVARAKAIPSVTLPPVAGAEPVASVQAPRVSSHKGYVVLKQFEYPAGLYGAHLANFIVLKGVPEPTGTPGHSSVINLNTLTCTGPLCPQF